MSEPVSPPPAARKAKKLPNPKSFTIVMVCIAAALVIGGVLLVTLPGKPAAHSLGFFVFLLGALSIIPVFRVRSRNW